MLLLCFFLLIFPPGFKGQLLSGSVSATVLPAEAVRKAKQQSESEFPVIIKTGSFWVNKKALKNTGMENLIFFLFSIPFGGKELLCPHFKCNVHYGEKGKAATRKIQT